MFAPVLLREPKITAECMSQRITIEDKRGPTAYDETLLECSRDR